MLVIKDEFNEFYDIFQKLYSELISDYSQYDGKLLYHYTLDYSQ